METLITLKQISLPSSKPIYIHQVIQHIHLNIPRADVMVSNLSKHVHIPEFFLGATIHLFMEARNIPSPSLSISNSSQLSFHMYLESVQFF